MKPRGIALHWKILVGLSLGVAVGTLLNIFWTPDTWAALGVQDAKAFLKGTPADANAAAGLAAGAARVVVNLNDFIGRLFLRGLRFIAVPITLFALIVGVASLGDIRKIGRIGGKTLVLFVLTTALSVVIGLGFSNLVRPGHFVPDQVRQELAAQRAVEAAAKTGAAKDVKSTWDLVLEMVPTNPFKALADGDMLQVVVLSLVIGIGLTFLPRDKSAPVVKLCDAMAEAILVVVRLLMELSPIAVFALMAPIVAGTGFDVLRALAVYCLVVVAGLAAVMYIVFPVMLWTLTPRGKKVSLRRFTRAMAPAQLVAFSSSSSNATLPVTIECCRDRLGVSEEVTSFVCPLGATVNMNGTALYQAVVVTFLAQLYGIPLTFADQAVIVVMATLSAIGTAGVPGASIVLLVMVLQAVHVPVEGIAIILAVDRVLDMCRTVVNITGDAAVAAVVAGSEGQLGPEPARPQERPLRLHKV